MLFKNKKVYDTISFMKRQKVVGFEACYNKDSKILILGSFPSVISREVSFYYGNPRNRFWSILAEAFNCAVPHTRAEKIDFVLSRNLALWDVVKECTIEGSKDTSIRDIVVADIEKIIKVSNIKYILLNGNKSAEIFYKNYPKLKDIAIKLPSTSPANVRLDKNIWINKIRELI